MPPPPPPAGPGHHRLQLTRASSATMRIASASVSTAAPVSASAARSPPLRFADHRFYINLTRPAHTPEACRAIELVIRHLGGQVDKFYSKEISHILVDTAVKNSYFGRSSDQHAPLPQTASSGSTKSNLSSLTNNRRVRRQVAPGVAAKSAGIPYISSTLGKTLQNAEENKKKIWDMKDFARHISAIPHLAEELCFKFGSTVVNSISKYFPCQFLSIKSPYESISSNGHSIGRSQSHEKLVETIPLNEPCLAVLDATGAHRPVMARQFCKNDILLRLNIENRYAGSPFAIREPYDSVNVAAAAAAAVNEAAEVSDRSSDDGEINLKRQTRETSSRAGSSLNPSASFSTSALVLQRAPERTFSVLCQPALRNKYQKDAVASEEYIMTKDIERVLVDPSLLRFISSHSQSSRNGFCERCQTRFESLEAHISSQRHMMYAADDRNWSQLDALVRQLNCPLIEFPEDSLDPTSTLSSSPQQYTYHGANASGDNDVPFSNRLAQSQSLSSRKRSYLSRENTYHSHGASTAYSTKQQQQQQAKNASSLSHEVANEEPVGEEKQIARTVAENTRSRSSRRLSASNTSRKAGNMK